MRHLMTLKYIDAVVREKSIRKAAEKMAITSTALNRRILAIEAEIGQKLFERLPSGVRLNAAGEIFIQYVRGQLSDLARVKSQIADLSGVRRGHVTIASSEDALRYFLPAQIARYRAEHPAVTFQIKQQNGEEAEHSLTEHHADIALIFEPVRSINFQVMATARQSIHCVMAHNHPLAEKQIIKLRDCIDYPILMSGAQSGVRQLLDAGLMRKPLELNKVIESDNLEFMYHYICEEAALFFQIPIALEPNNNGLVVSRPMDIKDVPLGVLHIGHLKGRVLSVAAAKFLDYIIQALRQRYHEAIDQ